MIEDEDGARIDINRADVATLATLPGIGEELARRIVQYRETVHPFEEIIELVAVPGVSERMVRQFEDQVTVSAPESSAGSGLGTGPAIEERPFVVTPLAEEAVAADPVVATDLAAAAGPADAAGSAGKEPAQRAVARERSEPEMSREPIIDPPQGETVAPPPTSSAAGRAAPAAPAPAGSALRRGCLFTLIGAVLGAVLGAILTLAILATLNNGTLFFSQSDARLRNEIDAGRQAQSVLNDELQALSGQIDAVATRTNDIARQQTTADQSLEDMAQEINNAQDGVATLQEAADEFDERLSTVATAAETFDTFLNGLRDLLLEAQGPPATATPGPIRTATATPAAGLTLTPTATATTLTPGVTATPIGTLVPTRTPRPTATPLALPSNTPAQQP